MKCENWLTKHFKIDIFITNKEESEQIEITKDIKQILDELQTYRTTPGRFVTLLKSKSKSIRILKPRIGFPANVEAFAAEPNRRVRRLEPSNPHPHSRRQRQGDVVMREENKEEEKKQNK